MECAHGIFHTDCNADFSPERRLSDAKSDDQFAIDDLLNFPNDVEVADDGLEAAMKGDSSSVKAADTSFPVVVNATHSHFPPADIGGPGHFAGELCVPHEVLPDLEWLSNFVDESFSDEDLQMLQGIKARTDHISSTNIPQFQPESTAKGPLPRRKSAPTKARSKRSRSALGKRTSRVVVSPTLPTAKKVVKPAAQKKDRHDGSNGRKCLHCATDKTPQWRTGPMGPKTLCNACGVRFKSGRLVPEYRPASSPTFVLTKHSNSHRKVLELRRQKEMQKAQMQPAALPYLPHHHHHNVMFDECDDDDCLIQQYIRPDYS